MLFRCRLDCFSVILVRICLLILWMSFVVVCIRMNNHLMCLSIAVYPIAYRMWVAYAWIAAATVLLSQCRYRFVAILCFKYPCDIFFLNENLKENVSDHRTMLPIRNRQVKRINLTIRNQKQRVFLCLFEILFFEHFLNLQI